MAMVILSSQRMFLGRGRYNSIYLTNDLAIPCVFTIEYPESPTKIGDPTTYSVLRHPPNEKSMVLVVHAEMKGIGKPINVRENGKMVQIYPGYSTKPECSRILAKFLWSEEKQTFVGPERGTGGLWKTLYCNPDQVIKNSAWVKPFDLFTVTGVPSDPALPINRTYIVEANGEIALGAYIGRRQLSGLSMDEAKCCIEKCIFHDHPSFEISVVSAGHAPLNFVLPNFRKLPIVFARRIHFTFRLLAIQPRL